MKFTVGFEREDTKKLYNYWNKILETHQWTEGFFTKSFEEKWSEYNNAYSVAFNGWGSAALAAMEFFNAKDKLVLCPSNTFMATPLSGLFHK